MGFAPPIVSLFLWSAIGIRGSGLLPSREVFQRLAAKGDEIVAHDLLKCVD